MTSATATTGYSHTQKAPLGLLVLGLALVCFGIAWVVGDRQGVAVTSITGLSLVLVAAAFHHLTVEDRGAVLVIRFGPLPLFRRTVKYADMAAVVVGRTLVLDGWGIHYSVRGGWVWNIWGRDCVVVRFKDGRTLRIGTDDATNLARFLAGKIDEHGSQFTRNHA